MAESEPRSVGAEAQPETHGNRLTRSLKKVKPGEWVLIGIGVVGLVIYFIWYQNQQNGSTNALTPAGGTSNPWSASNVDPSQLDADIQALTSALENGQASVPNTGSTAPSGGTTGGSTPSSGSDPDHDKTASDTQADARVSSGAGISQASNNQAPVGNVTQFVQATASAPTPAPAGNQSRTPRQPSPAEVAAAQQQSINHPSTRVQTVIANYGYQQPTVGPGVAPRTNTGHIVRGPNPSA